MRLLHLYWPHLPIRLARSRHSDSFPTDRPVVAGQAYETITISLTPDLLARGVNVLAIQGLNDSRSSSDFLIQAELEATRAQCELARLVSLPAGAPLPLPSDRPHVGSSTW